jgi:class 3 adenylate cyclase/tetratricopeptide (TPR) repeat protein
MVACPRCEQQNPDDARFCKACGALLGVEAPRPREERKFVSVLFADLVGFTGRAERLDPEDVRAILAVYHERVRAVLERRGATVEKFIGDAVMALFGAPVAHEDDPERAVLAAVAIRNAIVEPAEHGDRSRDLHVRIAITTGEALVSVGARPEKGEGMAAGDVVNTAARLQAAAPVDGILVDEATYLATRDVIDYEPHRPVATKGKEAPVIVFEALNVRSQLGVDVPPPFRSPLVGREHELGLLEAALSRARTERKPQLVTLVGVPGIGKSRLVRELLGAVEAEPELINWRQGRCLPYGDGVTYWALGEIVKAQASILESDSAPEAAEKLHVTVHDLVEADAEWVETHLRPLVGLAAARHLPAEREEAFNAWQRFLEALAERGPTVLVFEDLHWADDGLLDFVDHLVEWAAGVPLLVICTARPELFARRPSWGGGKQNAVTASLSPLSHEEMTRLVYGLLDGSALPAETQAALIERAGGNPLYGEEFARMAAERGEGGLLLPQTIQGIIAARLDALTLDEKQVLQDGAVVGKVFWLGAVAAIAGSNRANLEEWLHALERKEFVRRERRSSVKGEREFVFSHVLIRDVAYNQIPRAPRAEKHRRTAEWIRLLDRPEDHAETLAHHYVTALELARAVGRGIGALVEPTRIALREAGDRALAISAFGVALRFYRNAIELTRPDSEDLPELLFLCGKARYLAEEEGEEELATAREALLQVGASEMAAEADVMIADMAYRSADRDRTHAHLERAAGLLADAPSSPSKAYVLASLSRFHMIGWANEDAIRVGEEARGMAEELELADIRAFVLNNIGVARIQHGDVGGLTDLERSIAIAEEIHDPWHLLRGYLNLALMLGLLGDLHRSGSLYERALPLAKRFGVAMALRLIPVEQARIRYWSGRWDEAERLASGVIAAAGNAPWYFGEPPCRSVRGAIRLARGDCRGALDDAAKGVEVARGAKDPQILWPALAFHGRLALAVGQREEGQIIVGELLELWHGTVDLVPGDWVLDFAWALQGVERSQELLEGTARAQLRTPWLNAATAIASGDLRMAADILADMGELPDEAYVRLRRADLLMAEGRRSEAKIELDRTHPFFRTVGASRYVSEAEKLLATSA